jgi:hypothetical protein
MGFDSIYQDWKEKGLFVRRLRIQHRKISPMEIALPRMTGYGCYSLAFALVIVCGICWVCLPTALMVYPFANIAVRKVPLIPIEKRITSE